MTAHNTFTEGDVVPWHDSSKLPSLQDPNIKQDSSPGEALQPWVDAVGSNSSNRFCKRLEWDNLSVDKISQWLNQVPSPENSSACNASSDKANCYLFHLESILRSKWDLALVPVQESEGLPFLDLWIPIQEWASSLIRNEVCSDNNRISLSPKSVEGLIHGLFTRLCKISEQVLWEEFHRQQTAGELLFAHVSAIQLEGCDISREKYESFIFSHRRDGLNSLFLSYPVLRRFVSTVISQWHENTVEIIRRLINDSDKIADAFNLKTPLRLSQVYDALSDPHQGGRTVCFLCFDISNNSGQDHEIKIIYKPKSMDMELGFQDFIDYLNRQTQLSPLRTVKVLSRGSYGYMEYVDHIPASNSEELDEFYYNAGRLTGILHVLGCTDCHYENLVASRNQLVLIDTETLFEPLTRIIDANTASPKSAEPSELRKRFQVSVLRTGLLPRWQIVGPKRLAVDISALGISPPPSSTYKKQGWIAINTDGMLPGLAEVQSEIPTSLPVSIGARNPLSLHLDVFCRGFSDQLEILHKLHSSKEGQQNLLSHFSGLVRRIIVRGTHVYTTLREQQLRPSSLRTSFAQSLVLERLAAGYLIQDTKPGCWPLLADEIRQMNQLDIPFFVHSIDGTVLGTPCEEAIASCIDANGLASSIGRLNSLDSSEINFQVSLIRGAVLARSPNSIGTSLLNTVGNAGHYRPESRISSEAAQYPADYGVSCARRIADHLLSLAITDSAGNADWLGMDLSGDSLNVTFGPVGINLYGGSIGVACLLSLLSRVANRPNVNHDYLSAVKSIVRPLWRLAEDSSSEKKLRWWRNQPLGLAGSGGTLLALQALGHSELVGQLFEGLRAEVLEADQGVDVISGMAGLVGCLLNQESGSCTDLACLAGDLLCERQRPCGSWSTSASRNRGLVGMSHGTSGILAALARLYNVTLRPRYRESILKALSYERALYDSNRKNWPDLRGKGDSFMTTWCHGAPGIALSRASLWGTDLWDEAVERELNIAIATTASSRPGYDHLCCGRLGILGILQLLHVGPWGLDQDVSSLCQVAISELLEFSLDACSEEKIRFCCFSTQEGLITVPGFFNGLSGIGIVLAGTPVSNTMMSRFLTAGLWPLEPQGVALATSLG